MRIPEFSRCSADKHYRSPYIYSDCDILINLKDIKDVDELSRYEEEMTGLRQLILEEELPVKGRFSVTHLKRLHEYIFQDIYPFAGKFRIEDIEKDETKFTPFHCIQEQLHKLLGELKSEKCLIGLTQDAFSNRIAYFMIELNMIHPFREGNGRVIRMFLRQLSIQRGYEIDWAKADGTQLLNAMISGVVKDYQPLTDLIRKLIVVCAVEEP